MKENAHAKAVEARHLLDLQAIENGFRAEKDGDDLAALLWFAQPLENPLLTPESEEAVRQRLATYLRYQRRHQLVQIVPDDDVDHGFFFTQRKLFWGTEDEQLRFSSDGKRVLIGVDSLQEWDILSGRPATPRIEAKLLPKQGDSTIVLVQSVPQEDRAVLLTSRGTLAWFDLRQGKLLGSSELAFGEVAKAAFSPDCKWVVATREDGSIRVWSTENGKASSPTWKLREKANSVTFSPNGQGVLVTWDETAQIWDAATGRSTTPLLGHGEQIHHVLFSPDGRWLLTRGGRAARLWDAATGQAHGKDLQHTADIGHAAFSPNGLEVVTAGSDHLACVWDVKSCNPIGVLRHPADIHDARFSPDGRLVATCCTDGLVRIWNARKEKLHTASLPHPHCARRVIFSKEGRQLAVVHGESDKEVWSWMGGVRVWDAVLGPSGNPDLTDHRLRFRGRGGHQLMFPKMFTPDGTRYVRQLWIESKKGAILEKVAVHDTASGKQVSPPFGTPNVRNASFSPDGRKVFTADGGGGCVWDATTGQPLTPPLKHDSPVMDGCFTLDGKRLISRTYEGAVHVWDVATGNLLHQIQAESKVLDARFSADGRRVVTVSSNGTAQQWDAETGRPTSPPMPLGCKVEKIALSRNGKLMFGEVVEGGARVWDLMSGKPVTPLLPHERGAVFDVTGGVTPDGSRVLTAPSSVGELPNTIGDSVPASAWSISPDHRFTDDLQKVVQIAAGGRILDKGVQRTLTKRQFNDVLHSLREKCPNDYTVTPARAANWHCREAEDCLREKTFWDPKSYTPDADAALFHIQWALHHVPKNAWAFSLRGQVQGRRKNWEQADADHRLALWHGGERFAAAWVNTLFERLKEKPSVLNHIRNTENLPVEVRRAALAEAQGR